MGQDGILRIKIRQKSRVMFFRLTSRFRENRVGKLVGYVRVWLTLNWIG